MPQESNVSHEYLKNAVMTATPEQLQLMLLDGAVRFTEQGRRAIEARDWEATFNALERAQRICLQLASGLDKQVNEGLALQMEGLFNFCYLRIVHANFNRQVEPLDEALRVLREQRDTWQIIAEKVAAVRGDASATEGGQPGSSEETGTASDSPRSDAAPALEPRGSVGNKLSNAVTVIDDPFPARGLNVEG